MNYRRYREFRLPIGSGTVESACKNVVAASLKQSRTMVHERREGKAPAARLPEEPPLDERLREPAPPATRHRRST